MPPRNLIRAFLVLWWTLGVLLFWYSVRTLAGALSGADAGAHSHLAVLAGGEAIAALLFLVPRTMRIGGLCLLVIFFVAFIFHAAHGEFASQLILYGATVAYVVVHGAQSALNTLRHGSPGTIA